MKDRFRSSAIQTVAGRWFRRRKDDISQKQVRGVCSEFVVKNEEVRPALPALLGNIHLCRVR
jgi:hypothetical protein